ncbi:MAG: phosphotransacetylase family protein [Xenococcaceae cyanobacterium MO_188.B32]|nr:phosphotransacetylase family protein [Xenococcaceae cyanobacterium MO_188.B32]
MAKTTQYLLVGSTEAYSGKSATIVGLTHQLAKKGISVAYGKPLGTCLTDDSTEILEEDISFLSTTLELSDNQIKLPLLYLDKDTINRRLQGKNTTDYSLALQNYFPDPQADLVFLEGPGNLSEGSLFHLSIPEMAEIVDASILLVSRYSSLLLVSSLLAAKKFLGDRFLGVVINDIPQSEIKTVSSVVKPYLEQQNIPVLGMLPQNNLLHSVRVRELATRLKAKVLCRRDRLDLMVESLSIGAMNVNSALEYFRQRNNMAVVTGGDRTDLQLAALETSTHCLILTGHTPPQQLILSRAEDLEIPVLAVDFDTLTTVEIVDRSFGKVPIHEPIKVACIRELIAKHFDIDRLMNYLGLEPAVPV